jgi:hypothetical protein
MRGEKPILVILSLILCPIIVIFLMTAVGALMGSDPYGINFVVAGIVILCDVVISCTLIVVGMLNRLIHMTEEQKAETVSKNTNE